MSKIAEHEAAVGAAARPRRRLRRLNLFVTGPVVVIGGVVEVAANA